MGVSADTLLSVLMGGVLLVYTGIGFPFSGNLISRFWEISFPIFGKSISLYFINLSPLSDSAYQSVLSKAILL